MDHIFSMVTRTCPFCGKTKTIAIPYDTYVTGMIAWQNGTLIQNAFPTLDANTREFIKTGICEQCWNNM